MKIICPPELEELRYNESDGWFPKWVATKFRIQCSLIEIIDTSMELYKYPTLRFHKLHGDLQGFHAIDLNRSWRMEVKILQNNTVEIMKVYRISNHYQ